MSSIYDLDDNNSVGELYASSIQTIEDFARSGVCKFKVIYCAFSLPTNPFTVRHLQSMMNRYQITTLKFQDKKMLHLNRTFP